MDVAEPATLPTEVVAISDLRPHPKNYRRHPDDQLDHIAASLKKHGQYRNVVTARDLTILAGHGVAEAAQRKLGWTELTVIRLDIDPDDPTALMVMTGDNEISRLAEIDDRLLSDHLRELAQLDSLLGTGFDDAMLANLVFVTRPAHEVRTMDDAGEWVGLPGFEPAGGREPLLVVHFDTVEDREKFINDLSIIIIKKMHASWSCWWPPRKREDPASLLFDTPDDEHALTADDA